MEQFNKLPTMSNGKRPMSGKTVAGIIAAVFGVLALLMTAVLVFAAVHSARLIYSYYNTGYFDPNYYESHHSDDYYYDDGDDGFNNYLDDFGVNEVRSFSGITYEIPEGYEAYDYESYVYIDFADGSGSYMSIAYYPYDEQISSLDTASDLAEEMSDAYDAGAMSDIEDSSFKDRKSYDFSLYLSSEDSIDMMVDFKMFNYGSGVAYIELSAPTENRFYYDYEYERLLDSIELDTSYESTLK